MAQISVIMSVYNESENYLRKSVESILNQTLKDFEFIIILDNPDNLIAKEILLDYAGKDSRIILHFNKSNIGLTKSLNIGLGLANCEFVARMDADDISEVNRLEYQIRYLKENNLDLVGSSLVRISENEDIVYKFTNPSYPPECIAELLRYDDCVPHPSWFVKRAVYTKLNGYRDIHSCEDYDFLLRAVKQGYRIGICDAILLKYRINTKGISRTNSLKQMLSAKYIKNNFYRIDEVNQDKINRYLEKYITDKDERNYEKSLKIMSDLIEDIKNKKFLNIIRLPMVVALSRYSVYNLKTIIKLRSIKRRYR